MEPPKLSMNDGFSKPDVLIQDIEYLTTPNGIRKSKSVMAVNYNSVNIPSHSSRKQLVRPMIDEMLKEAPEGLT